MNRHAGHNLLLLFTTVTGLFVSPFFTNVAHAEELINFSKWGANITDLVFTIFAWIMTKIGQLLDLVVEMMVLNMAENLNNIDAISGAWTVMRDVANLFFIFVLIYAAIAIILNVGNSFNAKQVLVRLVIVALLVNFSMFASRVVIDTSNILALQFYNNITIVEEDSSGNAVEIPDANISWIFASVTNISSLHGDEVIENAAQQLQEDGEDSLDYKLMLVRVLGTVFVVVAGFVMGAVAALLILRFGVLILLIILSPLAFVAYILPKMQKHAERWWNELISNAFFAPAFFGMFYLVAKVITSQGFREQFTGNGSNLATAIADPTANMSIIINFILITILMVAALIIAKQMGAAGGKKAVSWGKSARKWGQAKVVGAGSGLAGAGAGAAAWTGRQTVGRGAQKISESQRLKNQVAEGGFTGWVANKQLKLADKTAQKSFDARNTSLGKKVNKSEIGKRKGGFRGTVKQQTKKYKEMADRVGELSTEEQGALAEQRQKKQPYKGKDGKIAKAVEEHKAAKAKEAEIESQIQEAQIPETKTRLREDLTAAQTTTQQKANQLETVKQEADKIQEKINEIENAGERRKDAVAKRLENELSFMDKVGSWVDSKVGLETSVNPTHSTSATLGKRQAAREIQKSLSKNKTQEAKVAEQVANIIKQQNQGGGGSKGEDKGEEDES